VVSFVLVTVLSCGLAVFAGVLRTGERRTRSEVGPQAAAVPDPRP